MPPRSGKLTPEAAAGSRRLDDLMAISAASKRPVALASAGSAESGPAKKKGRAGNAFDDAVAAAFGGDAKGEADASSAAGAAASAADTGKTDKQYRKDKYRKDKKTQEPEKDSADKAQAAPDVTGVTGRPATEQPPPSVEGGSRGQGA